MHRLLTLVVPAALLIVGCGQVVPAGPSAAPTTSASVAAPTSSPVVVISPDAGATTSDDASNAPTPSASPSVPDASGALDVSATVEKAGYASFASPSGKIWCGFEPDRVICNFPSDYAARIPSEKKVCPEDAAAALVAGVEVTGDRADYYCAGDIEMNPALDDTDDTSSTAWWPATGWPSVKVDGRRLATLPYGRRLVAGDFVCASGTDGVTCGDPTTGQGFRMARAGVVFIN